MLCWVGITENTVGSDVLQAVSTQPSTIFMASCIFLEAWHLHCSWVWEPARWWDKGGGLLLLEKYMSTLEGRKRPGVGVLDAVPILLYGDGSLSLFPQWRILVERSGGWLPKPKPPCSWAHDRFRVQSTGSVFSKALCHWSQIAKGCGLVAACFSDNSLPSHPPPISPGFIDKGMGNQHTFLDCRHCWGRNPEGAERGARLPLCLLLEFL